MVMVGNGGTCPYHEDRGNRMAELEAAVSAHNVEITNMKDTVDVLFDKMDIAVNKSTKILDRLCDEIKQIKITLAQTGRRTVREEKELARDEALEGEPIGFLNQMLKKLFTSPVFWAIVGWALVKIVLFGEYPAFIKTPRPYMADVVKSQKALEIQHKELHDMKIPHVHDEQGNPTVDFNGNHK